MTCLSSTKRKALLTLNPIAHKTILWEWRRNRHSQKKENKNICYQKTYHKRQATGVPGVKNLKRKLFMEEIWDFKKKEKNNVMSKSKQTVLLMSFAKVVWQLKQKRKKNPIWCSAYKKAILYRQLKNEEWRTQRK